LSASKKLRLKLNDVSERGVLKYGVQSCHRRLASQDSELPPLPKRPDGSSKLLQRSFFERLLAAQLDLQTSLACDVSAAQNDIRHLALEHLLLLRVRSLDFNTSSSSHEAHNGFLMKLDQQLYEQLANRLLAAAGVILPASRSAERLHRLGFQTVLVSGAVAILSGNMAEFPPSGASSPSSRKGSCSSQPSSSGSPTALQLNREADEPRILGEASPLPRCWALPLDAELWPEHQLALLSLDADADAPPRLRLLPRALDAAEAAEKLEAWCREELEGSGVAVIFDRSRERRLHWEISVLFSSAESGGGQAVLAEVAAAERATGARAVGIGGSAGAASPLGRELSAALLRRGGASAVEFPKASSTELLSVQSVQSFESTASSCGVSERQSSFTAAASWEPKMRTLSDFLKD
ncbi:unnamed protein product, partial [Polarella glacialis]